MPKTKTKTLTKTLIVRTIPDGRAVIDPATIIEVVPDGNYTLVKIKTQTGPDGPINVYTITREEAIRQGIIAADEPAIAQAGHGTL